MQGVPSSLIARNESWVRKQAQTLVRHLPSNVEKADLIQVGLIAVAQAALGFEWEGDRDTEEAREAFVRYARMRVKGAMLDELRQMDHLGRGQRRKIKAIEIARERLRSTLGGEPGLAQLSDACGIEVDEISQLQQADQAGRARSTSGDDEDGEHSQPELHPATERDEVEARVDTAIVMRRLERFFTRLPERERMVIDSYLGIGLTPTQLAQELQVSPSRVSQMFKSTVDRVAVHFGQTTELRATDRVALKSPRRDTPEFDDLVTQREDELARSPTDGPWGELVEQALLAPLGPDDGADSADDDLRVTTSTRWG